MIVIMDTEKNEMRSLLTSSYRRETEKVIIISYCDSMLIK